MMNVMKWRRLRAFVLLTTLALLAVACGSEPPTSDELVGAPTGDTEVSDDTGETSTTPTNAAAEDSEPVAVECENGAALQEVYAAVDGLSGEERAQTLLELSEDEPNLNVYGSTNLDDVGPLFEDFEDTYDLEPSYYRATSSDVLNRILQEADAGLAGNDVVMANGPELVVLDDEGMLLPLSSPATEDIIEAGVFDNWASMYLNTFIAGWNSNNVDDAPADDFISFLQSVDGPIAIELGDWDWFATLTKYLMEEEGMTEEEVVQTFKDNLQGARVIDGHTLMAELLIAGEFDAATSLYHHRVTQFMDEGAPLEWEAPVKPLIVRPNGIGLMTCVQAPAKALLWVEFVLTRGQEIFAEAFRGPASTTVEGGIPDEYDSILVDIDAVTDEREKWEGIWQEIVESTGSETVGE